MAVGTHGKRVTCRDALESDCVRRHTRKAAPLIVFCPRGSMPCTIFGPQTPYRARKRAIFVHGRVSGRLKIVHGTLVIGWNRTRHGSPWTKNRTRRDRNGIRTLQRRHRPMPGTYMPRVRRAVGALGRRGRYIALVRRHLSPTPLARLQVIIFIRYSCHVRNSVVSHKRHMRAQTPLDAQPTSHT